MTGLRESAEGIIRGIDEFGEHTAFGRQNRVAFFRNPF
jgi:hypothetical protein